MWGCKSHQSETRMRIPMPQCHHVCRCKLHVLWRQSFPKPRARDDGTITPIDINSGLTKRDQMSKRVGAGHSRETRFLSRRQTHVCRRPLSLSAGHGDSGKMIPNGQWAASGSASLIEWLPERAAFVSNPCNPFHYIVGCLGHDPRCPRDGYERRNMKGSGKGLSSISLGKGCWG